MRTSIKSILTTPTLALETWLAEQHVDSVMPRLFTAIEIPRSIADRLSMLRAGLHGARWIDPENYHVTLRFIGDVDSQTARDVTDALGQVIAEPFTLKLNGLGSFGGNKPRAMFAGLEPSPELEALQHAHEGAARMAGLAPERRNFKPHITIARLRGARPSAVAAYLADSGLIAESFPVARVVLYSSRNSVGGGPYVIEAAYDLDDDEPGYPGSYDLDESALYGIEPY